MSDLKLPGIQLKVVFSDDDILVVDKPTGMLSVADGYDSTLPHLSSVLTLIWGQVWIVHRLDRRTSGLLVIARNPEAHRNLNQQFREHQVTKLYHAVVTPVPDWVELSLNTPLRVDADREHRTRVDALRGKSAQTNMRIIRTNGKYALLECQILTGYRHQIRAHLYSISLGIIGDELYQPNKSTITPVDSRIMLHAAKLSFVHPATGKTLSFESPDPIEFSAFI